MRYIFSVHPMGKVGSPKKKGGIFKINGICGSVTYYNYTKEQAVRAYVAKCEGRKNK